MEKNHVNVQGTEDYKEGNTSLTESVAKASIEEGVPVMKKMFSWMIQAVCGILSLTLRIIFRH